MILLLFQLRFIQSLPERWILDESEPHALWQVKNQTGSGQGAEGWTLYALTLAS